MSRSSSPSRSLPPGHVNNAGLFPSGQGTAHTLPNGHSGTSLPAVLLLLREVRCERIRARGTSARPGLRGPRPQLPSTTGWDLEGLPGVRAGWAARLPATRHPKARHNAADHLRPPSNSDISFHGRREDARGAGTPHPQQAPPETAPVALQEVSRGPSPTRRVPRFSHVRRRGPEAPTPPAPPRAQRWVGEEAGAPDTVAGGQASPARPAPRPRASLPLGRGRGPARPHSFPHRVCYLVWGWGRGGGKGSGPMSPGVVAATVAARKISPATPRRRL